MAESVTNEVLASELRNLTTVIVKLENKFDAFTPSAVLDLKFAEINTRLLELSRIDKELELKLDKMKQKSSFQTWLTGTLSAGMGVLMTFLISFYLSNK